MNRKKKKKWVQSVPKHTQTFSANTYTYMKNKSILYLRYINDIFTIWEVSKQELRVFLENLNSKHKKIKFEHNISHSKHHFCRN